MSGRAPRRKPPRRRKQAGGRRSPWAYLAPAALLGAVTVIVLILSSAGWIGHPADGGPSVSTVPSGPVETLPVPNTPPPPAPAPPEPPPLPPPPATTKTTGTTTSTSASTTPATSTSTSTTAATTTAATTAVDTTSTATATTAGDGQHVKWTVKKGDTLFSIATQFGTSVKQIQRLNPSIDPAALQVGQTLVVK